MSEMQSLQCPKCGGEREKDLRQMRRITGWSLAALSLGGFVTLAVVSWRAPWWLVASCVLPLLLGVVALRGAEAARYCADCNIRLEASTDSER